MNVLVLMLDSLRPDFLGCGGRDTVLTPHIDEIAARGLLFRNACTEYPPPARSCSSSASAVLLLNGQRRRGSADPDPVPAGWRRNV